MIRICVSVHACAYEIFNDPLIPDTEYDQLAKRVNKDAETGHKELDSFFRDNYDPSTAMWIYGHPELSKVKALYKRLKKDEIFLQKDLTPE